jgi:TolB-like protein/Flp pilus assembly protein TadD
VLELRVLGELAICRDGAVLRLPQSKKTRALLAYLALEGRPVRRERLTTIFWEVPDDPRGALRWSLSKLRETVGPSQIVADRDSVAFEPADTAVDLATVRALDRAGLDKAPLEALEAAAGAFRAELLSGLDLPDCHDFQIWLAAMREEAAALHRRLLQALVRREAAQPARALPHARRLVELDPLDAPARIELMRLLIAAGHGREAEEQYRLGSRVLDEAGASGATALRKAWVELRDARQGQAAETPVAASPAILLNRPAVAVLPFDNMSGDPEQDYFADGITDDVITALSQWRWFPVIARASSFAYKRQGGNAIGFARELGARYAVQGSVRRAGNRLRVTVQLVDAIAGHQLWAERYDREIGDVFALQDELTESIVVQVAPEVARVEGYRAERKAPADLTVWDLNLRALAQLTKGTAAGLAEAKAVLQQSLALNPAVSHTHALMALRNYYEALLVWIDDPTDTSGAVLEAAEEAVRLDERNWLAHAMHGLSVMWHRRDYQTAATAERRALALNPSAALAHQFQGCVLTFAGAAREALVHLDAALRLNPQGNTTMLLSDMALAFMLIGEHESAVANARRAVGQFAGDVRAHQRLVAALGHLGRRDEAKAALAELERRQPNLTRRYIDLTYPFRDPADLDMLLAGLKRAGWRRA